MAAATTTAHELDFYAIRLESYQSLVLFGLFNPKKTLTWRDVAENRNITLRACVRCGLPSAKLHRMQPDIKEWIRLGKATAQDCEHMAPWRPNPFTDLGCSLGDLIVYRSVLPPSLLVQSGITVDLLLERHGLTVELMIMLKYTPEDWLELGLPVALLDKVNDLQWKRLFGMCPRAELAARAARAASSAAPPPLGGER